MELKDLNTTARPTWCPGCGNFGIWNAVKRAIVAFGSEPHNTVIVGGVGCSSKIPHWVRSYGFHGLHGRPVPVATGIKLANHELNVICMAGDGDQYDEGANHLIHAARRNINLTLVVHNNQVFGLTKGQTSPTSEQGYVSKTSPWGAHELPVNPLALALAAHATFVARGFAAEMDHLAGLIASGMKHKGFALIDVLQPCVSFNHHNTFDWYRKRVYKLSDDHNTKDLIAAFTKAQEWGDRIPIGIFYDNPRPTFDGMMAQLNPGPLVHKVVGSDIEPLLRKYF